MGGVPGPGLGIRTRTCRGSRGGRGGSPAAGGGLRRGGPGRRGRRPASAPDRFPRASAGFGGARPGGEGSGLAGAGRRRLGAELVTVFWQMCLLPAAVVAAGGVGLEGPWSPVGERQGCLWGPPSPSWCLEVKEGAEPVTRCGRFHWAGKTPGPWGARALRPGLWVLLGVRRGYWSCSGAISSECRRVFQKFGVCVPPGSGSPHARRAVSGVPLAQTREAVGPRGWGPRGLRGALGRVSTEPGA